MEHVRGVLASLLAVALGLTSLMPAAARGASCCCALMSAKSCPLQKAKRDCGSGHASCSIGAERDTNHRVATSSTASVSILTNRVEGEDLGFVHSPGLRAVEGDLHGAGA